MTDYGRRPDETATWGHSIPVRISEQTVDLLTFVLRILHDDAARTDLPLGSRYEIRIATDRGIAWYHCAEMDAVEGWGSHHGRRDGYYLVGQFLTPGNPK